MGRPMSILQGWAGDTLAVVRFMSGPPSVVSSEAKVTTLKRDCQRLLRKQPCANVALKPGVDVSGNKVTGTNPHRDQKIKRLKEFYFNLSIDIAQKYELNAGGVGADMAVGQVVLKGRNLWFKDQRFNSADHAAGTSQFRKTLNGC